MYLLLNILLVALNGMLQAFAVSFCLTPKNGKKHLFLFYLMLLPLVTLKCTIKESAFALIFGNLTMIALFVYSILVYKETFWYKLFICSISVALVSVPGDIFLAIVVKSIMKMEITLNYTDSSMLLPVLLSQLPMVFFGCVFILIVKSFKKRKEKSFAFHLTFLLPLLSVFAYTTVILISIFTSNERPVAAFFALALLIMNIFLIYLFLHRVEKDNAEHSLQELVRLQELEQLSFQEFERYNNELSKIRHDFANQLTAINLLLETKDYNTAAELADGLEKQLNGLS